MKKLVIIFKSRKYFDKVCANIGPLCGPRKQFSTTSLNKTELSMTIERGEIVDPYAIMINCLQLSDGGGDYDWNQMTLAVAEVESLNGRDPLSFGK